METVAPYTDLITQPIHRDPLIRHAVISAALGWVVASRSSLLAKAAALGGVTLLRRPKVGDEWTRLIEGGCNALSHLCDALLILATLRLWGSGNSLLALPMALLTALWLLTEGAVATDLTQKRLGIVKGGANRLGMTIGSYGYKLLWTGDVHLQKPSFLR